MKDIIVAQLDDMIAQNEAAGFSVSKITLSPDAFVGLLNATGKDELLADPDADLPGTYKDIALEHRELPGTRYIEITAGPGQVFYRDEED